MMSNLKQTSLAVANRLDLSTFLSSEISHDFQLKFESSSQSILSNENGLLSNKSGRLLWPSNNFHDDYLVVKDAMASTLEKFGSDSCPATRTLEVADAFEKKRKTGDLINDPCHKKMILQRDSLKRSRLSLEEFDMSGLMEATEPIEDANSFPSIDWDFLDDDTEKEEIAATLGYRSTPGDLPYAKRRCGGLLRSKKMHDNLFLLNKECEYT